MQRQALALITALPEHQKHANEKSAGTQVSVDQRDEMHPAKRRNLFTLQVLHTYDS